MLIPNHPHDERLSALASGDPEVVADAALTEHVASCARCTDTVAELGALRASLAELPDLRPHRPLQLLPPVPDVPAPADRVSGWARRLFAPMLTAGAALALVGVVGTANPLGGMASSGAASSMDSAELAQPVTGAARGGDSGANASGEPAAGEPAPTDDVTLTGPDDAQGGTASEEPVSRQEYQSTPSVAPEEQGGNDAAPLTATDDRPLWPMLIFAGVAIMIAAALLRWILAPRAG
jgi:anti-sigma factor RsiW